MIELREYQEGAIRSLHSYMSEQDGNPLIVLPTASGKSVVIAEFIRRAVTEFPDTRILVLAHVAELLTQNSQELLGLWPQAPVGIYSASLKARNIRAQILFAGIQSIYKKAYSLQRVDLVFIDECHLLSPKGGTMYRKLLGDLKQINPYIRVIGLSATPYRLDSGHLCSGKDAFFHDVAYEAPVGKLIESGFLSPLISGSVRTAIDVSNVPLVGGDYAQGALEAAVNVEEITKAAVSEMVAAGRDRRAWLVFCSGVAHSYAVRDELREYGIATETITGETPKGERAAILAGYKAGYIRALTNANCLTTGINVRPIDLISFLRPTKSVSLYVQMAGRGMRLSPETGKTDCMVLDFAKLIETLGPVDEVRIKDKRKRDDPGKAPTKTCPQCQTGVFAAARECPECGYEYPPPPPSIVETASTLAILSSAKQPVADPTWVDVSRVSYALHKPRHESPDSLRVTYQCGLLQHSEWVLLQHDGGMKAKAGAWWRRRAQGEPIPSSVNDALPLTRFLLSPKQIAVEPSKKDPRYTAIVGYKFEDAA